ncbi:MAG: hypothetical protein WCU80_05745 [Paludibacteraceae bacterium]
MGRQNNSVLLTKALYDLWPNNPVGKTELQSDVKSDYSKGVVINSLSDLKTYDQNTKNQSYASKTANSGKAYNASEFNCSTFAENALKT